MSMRKRMSICIVSIGFPPDYTGAGLQMLTLAQRIDKNADLFVVSGQAKGLETRYNLNGVEVVRIKTLGKNSRKKIYNLTFCLNLFFFLLLRRNMYEIIHCIGGGLFLIPAYVAARLLRKKVSAKLTRLAYMGKDPEFKKLSGDDPDALRQRWSGRLVFHALKRIDAIICISRRLYDVCKKNRINLEKLIQIPNGVNTQFFKPVNKNEKIGIRKKLGLPTDARIACFVGNIRRAKRIDLIIKASADLLPYYPKFLLIFIGPRSADIDEYTSFVDNLIRKYSMDNMILFTGLKDQDSVKRYLQASDMYLFPSTIEGQPNSVMEAMACGLPCIAAASPAIERLIDSGQDGLIFNQENKDEFQKNIVLLLEDETIRNELGEKARKKMIDVYDIGKIADQYLNLYQKLLLSTQKMALTCSRKELLKGLDEKNNISK